MKILRAQLSNSEQILIMYNCSVGKGRIKFRNLVNDLSILHNVRIEDKEGHWENEILTKVFSDSAFRENDSELWPSREEVMADILGQKSPIS